MIEAKHINRGNRPVTLEIARDLVQEREVYFQCLSAAGQALEDSGVHLEVKYAASKWPRIPLLTASQVGSAIHNAGPQRQARGMEALLTRIEQEAITYGLSEEAYEPKSLPGTLGTMAIGRAAIGVVVFFPELNEQEREPLRKGLETATARTVLPKDDPPHILLAKATGRPAEINDAVTHIADADVPLPTLSFAPVSALIHDLE